MQLHRGAAQKGWLTDQMKVKSLLLLQQDAALAKRQSIQLTSWAGRHPFH
jgi:hypothetical protein